MKNILLVLSFLFILNLGYSQNSEFKKNEISVGLINLAESPKNQDILFENSYYFVPFSHLTFKRFLNEQNAIRFTYYRPINKSNEKPFDNWNDNSDYKEQVFKLGYEYIFKQKTITPYLALDISYLKSKSSRFSGGGITGLYNETESKINGIGLSPTVGIQYKIHNNVFIGLESNFTIFNLKEEKTSSQWSEVDPELNEPETTETDHAVDYVFNPFVFLVKVKF
ncbi:hypothetical protein JCM19274_2033 [Algibacter lectus]|uniref:Outer membrane protein beta-barrel domain-containing protein n=1 Tax=Algibacter lectus TaxID=221126 RepID=A0A090WR14_9FLAO|nr:hypothetical protein [Algibacter lectus]GAL79525.1 hypothetical protein JCM19274_2033 [Algibacter lectus]